MPGKSNTPNKISKQGLDKSLAQAAVKFHADDGRHDGACGNNGKIRRQRAAADNGHAERHRTDAEPEPHGLNQGVTAQTKSLHVKHCRYCKRARETADGAGYGACQRLQYRPERPDSLNLQSFQAVDGVAEQDDAEDGG